MHKSKNELYELVKDLKSRQEFYKEIDTVSKQYDNLIDEDTIALLIVDELGRNKHIFTKIADMKPKNEYSVIGKILNIFDSKSFTKKNGSSGRVLNLDISDETGTCRLVLWNKDVELAKDLKLGSIIKVINGYTKEGYSGVEINIGRWSVLEFEPKEAVNLDKESIKDINTLQGILVSKEPTKAFFKDNGDFGFVSKIKIKQDETEKSITLWDNKVKEIQKFKTGDKISINNFTIKNNDKSDIHVNGNAIIKKI